MPMLNEKALKELGKRLEEEYLRSYSTHIGKPAMKRLLGTLFFNLYKLKKEFQKNLDPFVVIGLEQRMNWISDWLTQDAYGHFFGNLYQIEYSLIYNNRSELQKRLNWTIGDLYTAHVLILQGNNLTDSLGSAFLDRLNGLVTVDCKLIDKKDQDFFKLAVINLCTLNSVLADYVNMTTGDQKDLAKKYLRLSFDSLERAFRDTEKLDENISLPLFVYLTLKNDAVILNEKIDLLEKDFHSLLQQLENKISKLRPYDIILSLCNLHELDEEKFRELLEQVFEEISKKVDWINRPFYVRMLILYLQDGVIGTQSINLNIGPDFKPLNVEQITEMLFSEYFANQEKVSISKNDLDTLMNYDDAEIRQKLANILQQSKYLSKIQKEQLAKESKKPHTGAEISDLELRIDSKPNGTIYVCLPVKSGKEIRTQSVPESYAYQIMKPFIHLYDNCVVIFVTARKCSQALDAYVKKLKSLYRFPIAVVQEEFLCRIFKFYNQLC